MPSQPEQLQKALQNPFAQQVYYFASTEAVLLREAAAQAHAALEQGDSGADFTRVDGPAPDMGSVIAAAGSISFFGTPRVVEIRELSPASMTDKDAEELAALFSQLENAVLVVTALYKDKRTATSKKAKRLLEAAAAAGYSAELAKPTRREYLGWMQTLAAGFTTTFAPSAAEALLDRAGDDRTLLQSETAKLAAISGYTSISAAMVEKYGALNMEADVFALSRNITGGRSAASFEKLEELLEQRHEPIAIAAALSGSYVDMLRVRVGTEKRLSVAAIFKEMGYTGNEYRLQKAKENAARYATPRLYQCVLCLANLDKALKSSALPDKSILLEAAVGELLLLGAK